MNTHHARSEQEQGIVNSKVARLIALGASMAANNESGFTEAVKNLNSDGVREEELRLAVQVAQTAKDRPANIMKTMADRLTGTNLMGEIQPGACPAEKMKDTPEYPVILLIGAASALAANCEPCLNKVIPDLLEAGVGDEDIRRALEIGQSVKDQKAEVMKEAADILAGADISERSGAGGFKSSGCFRWSGCNCG